MLFVEIYIFCFTNDKNTKEIMNDEKILKLCIITTIVGLIGLMIVSGYVNPEKVTINKIDKSKIDNQVELEAQVVSIQETKGKTKIIGLSDQTGKINMVIFPSTTINTKLEKQEKIKVICKVTQYNGQLELILEEPQNIKLL